MSAGRELPISRRERVLVVLIGLGITVFAFSVALFGIVLPSLDKPWGASASWEETIDHFWSDKKPAIALALNGLMDLALVGLALWCLYKVFMCFASDLDKGGYWNHLVAKRETRHRYRL